MKRAGMILTIGCAVLAGRAVALTPEFAKCMDAVDLGAFKNTQWLGCADAELRQQERLLNAAYKKLQAKSASPDAARALVIGQRAWLAFRTSWCDYEAKRMEAPGPEFNQLMCLAELAEAQTKRLTPD